MIIFEFCVVWLILSTSPNEGVLLIYIKVISKWVQVSVAICANTSSLSSYLYLLTKTVLESRFWCKDVFDWSMSNPICFSPSSASDLETIFQLLSLFFESSLESSFITQWHLGVHDLNSNRKWKFSCIWEIKMDQKTEVDQQYRFFLRIFFPTHFDNWKPK